jgi:hypothetical protein
LELNVTKIGGSFKSPIQKVLMAKKSKTRIPKMGKNMGAKIWVQNLTNNISIN